MSTRAFDFSADTLYAAYVGPANHAALVHVSEGIRKELVQRIMDLARIDVSFEAQARGQREADTRQWLTIRNHRSVSLSVPISLGLLTSFSSSRGGPMRPLTS